MESYAMPNYRIKASSVYDGDHAASQGRMNFHETTVKSGSWSAGSNNLYQWLQIDLGVPDDIVKRVATQGRNLNQHWPGGKHGQWVTKYTLEYSEDCKQFQGYKGKDQGTVKVISKALFCANQV